MVVFRGGLTALKKTMLLMKYNLSLTVTAIIISSLFLVMWVSACKDDDTGIPYFDFVIHSPGPQDSGFASAKVFDKTWEATAYIFPYYLEPQYVSVIFNTFTPEGYIRDEVHFGNFALQEGSYTVIEHPAASTLQDDHLIWGGYAQFQDDGDVIYGGYELDTTYNNQFHIDRIDTIAHSIEGRFEALFILRDYYWHANLARQVLFEEGKFLVKY